MLPGSIEKLHCLRSKSEGVFSNLLPFDVLVDTGTQNFLKIYYLRTYPCKYIA